MAHLYFWIFIIMAIIGSVVENGYNKYKTTGILIVVIGCTGALFAGITLITLSTGV